MSSAAKFKKQNLFNLVEGKNINTMYWDNMPEYVQEDMTNAYELIEVILPTKEDLEAFCDLIGQPHLKKDPSEYRYKKNTWYPELDRYENSNLRWIEVED